jgi:uracil-DNA glycosylase
MNAQPYDIAATESLLAFWRDAGVDACYLDAPVDHTHIAPPPVVQAVQRATASVATPLAGRNASDAIDQARSLAAGAATLQDLAAAIAAFDGCPLRQMGATQSVFGRGDANAPVLVIGEAPGAEEDQIGQPFVGQAGHLLDRMIEAAGLTGKVFMTNTVFWRPPGNRPPAPQEQAVCAPFLERTFALLKPKAVLLLGGATAKSVLQADEGIMKLRGQWKEWRLHEGAISAPVMPTLHPAFLLRQPQVKRLVWADLLSLAVRLETDSVEDHG